MRTLLFDREFASSARVRDAICLRQTVESREHDGRDLAMRCIECLETSFTVECRERSIADRRESTRVAAATTAAVPSFSAKLIVIQRLTTETNIEQPSTGASTEAKTQDEASAVGPVSKPGQQPRAPSKNSHGT